MYFWCHDTLLEKIFSIEKLDLTWNKQTNFYKLCPLSPTPYPPPPKKKVWKILNHPIGQSLPKCRWEIKVPKDPINCAAVFLEGRFHVWPIDNTIYFIFTSFCNSFASGISKNFSAIFPFLQISLTNEMIKQLTDHITASNKQFKLSKKLFQHLWDIFRFLRYSL